MKEIEDTYLGDGVYASFDGYSISLDLRGQDTTTKIALEPTVLQALDDYRTYIMETLQKTPNLDNQNEQA